MMVTVSMAESTDTGVAVIVTMGIVSVRVNWNGHWDGSVNVDWNMLLVDDWVWGWHLNWNGYWAFDWYSIWTINWYLWCEVSPVLEHNVHEMRFSWEHLRGPGSELVSQRQLDTVSRRGLGMVGAHGLGMDDRLEHGLGHRRVLSLGMELVLEPQL